MKPMNSYMDYKEKQVTVVLVKEGPRVEFMA